MVKKQPFLSIITPALNEEKNLPVLYEQLRLILKEMPVKWEWIIVDDHSTDSTFKAIEHIASLDKNVRGIRLSRNSGSHIALKCGLQHAGGDCVTTIAADMQDPPEVIPDLLAQWLKGNQIIWAVRKSREGEKASTRGFSKLYYIIMRYVVGIKELPANGSDLFLLDRKVVDAYNLFGEINASTFALLTWMGFKQASVYYDKKARLHGKSGWNLSKKIKLVMDSITSFSYFPIRAMSILGFSFSLLGFLYACYIIYHALTGTPPEGWSSLIVITLVIGGVLMVMLGVLGEYQWRTLDEARRRPPYIIEAEVNQGGRRRG